MNPKKTDSEDESIAQKFADDLLKNQSQPEIEVQRVIEDVLWDCVS